MQFDFFERELTAALRLACSTALRQRDRNACRRVLRQIQTRLPDDALLADFTLMFNALAWKKPRRKERLLERIARLSQELQPAAARVFPPISARDWLAPFWHEVQHHLPQQAYHADTPELHPAYLALRQEQWAEAIAHVQDIAHWRRQAQPLAWMAEAQFFHEGLEAAWPWLFELSWLEPEAFCQLAQQLGDNQLDKLLSQFERRISNDGDHPQRHKAFVWFPAWSLIARPELLPHLKNLQCGRTSPPERAYQLITHLLLMEQQARPDEHKILRKRLYDLHEGLSELYEMRLEAEE